MLKVMNDYDYPMPDGVENIATREDLKKLSPFDVTRTPMGRQLKAIEIIAQALRGKAIAQAGNTRFILAPGCSLPTYSYPPIIKAARDAVRG
jgi:hypothetical protein